MFGYPTKTEDLAKFYRINPDKIDYILCKYGSMENFVETYITNRTPGFETDGPLKDNIKHEILIDITNGTQGKAAKKIYNVMTGLENNSSTQRTVIFFDGQKVLDNLDTLGKREADVIRFRCGAFDQRTHTLEETGSVFQVTDDRIRQIESKAMRKLVGLWARKIKDVTICMHKDSGENGFESEENEQVYSMMNKIYRSNLIFEPDEEYSQEPDSISSTELNEIAVQMQSIQNARMQRGKEELLRTRNMGRRPMEEIMKISEQLNLNEHVAEIEATAINGISNGGQTSTSEAKELVNLRAMRDSLAEEVEKLKQQTKSAEQLLASYDALLKGTTQDNSQNAEAKGE